jgi:hypothetical protein
MGFLIFLFNYFSYDCVYKTNPIVRENNVYEIHNSINMSKYFWAFYFTDEYYKKIEDPDRYLGFHAIITTWNETMETKPVRFSKCNINKHFSRTGFDKEKIFQLIPHFYDSYCLDLDDEFYLLNGNTQIPRSSLDIYVMECHNKTMKEVDCIDY